MNPYLLIEIATMLVIVITITAIFLKKIKNSTGMEIIIAIVFGIQLWAGTRRGESLGLLEYMIVFLIAIYFMQKLIHFAFRKDEQPSEPSEG